jgi:predicted MFS family arabinose efflux permease
MQRRWQIIGILGLTQIISWGATYYAFSIVAPAIGAELGLSPEWLYGAFSWSLLVAGLVATPAGVLLDRYGGQWIMTAGSLLCGVGLLLLAHAGHLATYLLAWTLLGAAMALTLYEAAFATLNRKFHQGSRTAISTLTLFGGFASTVFWPLTQQLQAQLGWRDTYMAYGLLQLLLCAPLHLLLGHDPAPAPVQQHAEARHHTLAEALRHRAFWTLAMAFSANMFIFSALSVHLIPLLKGFGHRPGLVAWLAALIGPMQVLGRVFERTLARDTPPRIVGKFTFGALPLALLALLLGGASAWAAALFCMLYGLSNGILTIVRGTLPQAMFGRTHYGAISGAMAGPSLLAKAAGPLAAAAVLRVHGDPALLLGVLLAVALLSLGFYLAAIRLPANATSAPLSY